MYYGARGFDGFCFLITVNLSFILVLKSISGCVFQFWNWVSFSLSRVSLTTGESILRQRMASSAGTQILVCLNLLITMSMIKMRNSPNVEARGTSEVVGLNVHNSSLGMTLGIHSCRNCSNQSRVLYLNTGHIDFVSQHVMVNLVKCLCRV